MRWSVRDTAFVMSSVGLIAAVWFGASWGLEVAVLGLFVAQWERPGR